MDEIKQIEYGEGIRKFSFDMKEYDSGYFHGFTAATNEINVLKEEVQILKKEINKLNEKCKIKEDVIQSSWTDGYETAEYDSFHNKKTTYKNSDFYKERKK